MAPFLPSLGIVRLTSGTKDPVVHYQCWGGPEGTEEGDPAPSAVRVADLPLVLQLEDPQRPSSVASDTRNTCRRCSFSPLGSKAFAAMTSPEATMFKFL